MKERAKFGIAVGELRMLLGWESRRNGRFFVFEDG